MTNETKSPAQAAPVVAASELSDEQIYELWRAKGGDGIPAALRFARAVLAAATPAASVVPVEPPAFTDEMKFQASHIRNDIERDDMEGMWKAMWRAADLAAPAVQQPEEGGTPRARFEAWAKQSATPYDLREHKFIANGVRTFMQDRTQWAFEGYCGALGLPFLPAAPTQAEGV